MENITHIKSNKRRSGLYKIRNTLTGCYYVGSSNHIYRRCRRHKNDLRNRIHDNDYLQHAWNKYGESAFEFYLIQEVPQSDLLQAEQLLLDRARSEKSYNLEFSAERAFHTAETIEKIRKSLTGVKKSLAAREKQSQSVQGNKNHRFGVPVSSIIQTFEHIHSKERFTGTQLDFTRKFGFPNGSMSKIATGKRKSLNGWKLASSQTSDKSLPMPV